MLRYERQLEIKQQQVDEALTRIGRLSGYTLDPIVPALEQWRYRNKLEYSFGTDDGGRLICGFHAPGRWHEIVEVSDCLLASAAGNEARERVAEWCRGQGLTAYDRRTGEGLLRNLVVREGRRTGQLQVRLVTAPGELDADSLAEAVADANTSLLWTRTDALSETTQGGETDLLAGADRLEEQLGGLRLSISPEAFFQTNTEMAERLYGVAVEFAGLTGFERIYDLYCGIGTIGLEMAPRASRAVRTRADPRGGRRRDRERQAQRDRQRPLLCRRRPARAARARRHRRPSRCPDRRPSPGRALAEDRPPDHRGEPAAGGLRVMQPDDARAERCAADRGRLHARAGPPRRHVPADAAHRVRRRAEQMTTIERWWQAGDQAELLLNGSERHVFVRRFRNAAPHMTLLHGFPSSSHDWHKVAPALAERYEATGP